MRYRHGVTEPGEHWDTVYATKSTGEVSWFQSEPATSLRLLGQSLSAPDSLIDVGAGDSTLVDFLLDAGWTDVTILDVSVEALQRVRNRLGARSETVNFVAGDVRSWLPERTYDVWHDRAAFHFLVEATERDRYVEMATAAVVPGGVVVLGSFATDGPDRCSGLPTARYDADDLARVFGAGFILEHAEREAHTTPWGVVQAFTWVVLRRRAG